MPSRILLERVAQFQQRKFGSMNVMEWRRTMKLNGFSCMLYLSTVFLHLSLLSTDSRPKADVDKLAQLFDMPLGSPEHRDLESTAFMGGPLISVRYWLGRLLNCNLFRASDAEVSAVLVQYFSDIGCERGAELGSDQDAWGSIANFLHYQWQTSSGMSSTKTSKWGSAFYAVLSDPDLTVAEIAQYAETTEKQVARMSDVKWLKQLWKFRNTKRDQIVP